MSSLSRVQDRAVPGTGGVDEWDLLRATPDFDADEMQSVGLWLQPDPSAVAESYAEDSWTAAPASSFVPTGVPTAAEPWPEAASVASLLSDLFEVASTSSPQAGSGASPWGDAGRSADCESLFSGLEPLGDEATPWGRGSTDRPSRHSEAGWSGEPDVIEGDLLGVALQVGARAGLIEGGTGHQPETAAAGTRAPRAAPVQTPVEASQSGDLLDTALAAGERAGLMDGWGGGVQ